jgi:hypothetical protein
VAHFLNLLSSTGESVLPNQTKGNFLITYVPTQMGLKKKNVKTKPKPTKPTKQHHQAYWELGFLHIKAHS